MPCNWIQIFTIVGETEFTWEYCICVEEQDLVHFGFEEDATGSIRETSSFFNEESIMKGRNE